MSRPGSRLRAIAARIFDHTTMERVVDPMVADLQKEYAEATRRGRVLRGRIVLLAGYVVFLKTIAVCGAEAALRGWTVDDRSSMTRTVWFSIPTTAAATLVLVALPLLRVARFVPRVDPGMLVYLLPQALALAIPVGLTLGIFLGLRGRFASRRSTGAILGGAVLCSVACLVTMLWILPEANQEFRRLVFGQDGRFLVNGTNELTLAELSGRIDAYRRSGLWPNALLFAYHERWALPFATLVLALFALSVTRRLAARWSVSLAAFGIFFCYYALTWTARAAALQDALPAFVGAWLPNVVFAVMSIAVLALASPQSHQPSNQSIQSINQ